MKIAAIIFSVISIVADFFSIWFDTINVLTGLRSFVALAFLATVLFGYKVQLAKILGYIFGGYLLITGALGLVSIAVILFTGGDFDNTFNVLVYGFYVFGGIVIVNFSKMQK